jgi:Mrp family chromosome partitioning ATPase
MFGYALNAGLADHLETGLPLSKLIVPTNVLGLRLLSAGNVAPRAAELLTAGKLDALFQDPALEGFDRVVIDSAPINAVSDALNLVRYVGSVCLVIRTGKTPKSAVVRAYHELVEAGARSMGLVLNRVPEKSGNYYHYATGSYGDEGVYSTRAAKVSA